MKNKIQGLIQKAYHAFNSRDIDSALSTFHPDVEWPKAFEGGYVRGHEAIRSYWTRQWTEINPTVEPAAINVLDNESVVVTVHQLVKDLEGKVLFDGVVKHSYTVQDGLLRKMDIEG